MSRSKKEIIKIIFYKEQIFNALIDWKNSNEGKIIT